MDYVKISDTELQTIEQAMVIYKYDDLLRFRKEFENETIAVKKRLDFINLLITEADKLGIKSTIPKGV